MNFWYSANGKEGLLNSNIFLAGVTVLVGLSALYIYKKQKHDLKRNAAEIVLLEIQNAERQLRLIQERKDGQNVDLPESKLLMKRASWDKYSHLFVRDFTRDEWDVISDFYEKCQAFDRAVINNDSYFEKITQETRVNLQAGLRQLIRDKLDKLPEDHDDEKLKIANENLAKTLKMYADDYMAIMRTNNSDYYYNPMKPLRDAAKSLGGLDANLSLTIVGVKLGDISKRGVFRAFYSNIRQK